MSDHERPEISERSRSLPTSPPRERALLVGAELESAPQPWPLQESLDELARLADTAGLEVVGRVTQHLRGPQPRFYIGPGKVDEIAALRQQTPFDLLIFDDDLSPSQTRNLEDAVGARVLDRTRLILDIFAQHAATREGRTQVELAQYSYLLPRLGRSGRAPSRQAGTSGGGVGLRGPGETQLEQDRRAINRRIAQLREDLGELSRHRERARERRRSTGIPVVALVGYTNAGKSTLLNALAGADAHAEDRLFATLDPLTRRVQLPSGRGALLTDTVGFIQKLPTQLIAAFEATLEELREADLLLHVIDASHPEALRQLGTVEETLADIGADHAERLTVLNKIDLMTDKGCVDAVAMDLAGRLGLPGESLVVSAQRGWCVDELLAKVDALLAARLRPAEALIPYGQDELVALWHAQGLVEQQQPEAEGTYMRGRLPAALLPRIAAFPAQPGRAKSVGE